MPSDRSRRQSEKEQLYAATEAAVFAAREAVVRKAMEIGPAFQERFDRGQVDWIGTAYVVTFDGRSPVTRALVALGYARRNYSGAYTLQLHAEPPPFRGTQALAYDEALAKAAAQVLEEHLGQEFHVQTYDN